MEKIIENAYFDSIIQVPSSVIGDTVTYVIYRASNSSVFQSGSALYVGGIQWRVSFIPTGSDVFVVEVTRGDTKYTRKYKTADKATVGVSYTNVVSIPDSISSQTVTYIVLKADGTVFADGNMTFLASIHWKISFTPDAEGTYKLQVLNVSKDVIYSEEIIVSAAASATAAVVTSASMLEAVNNAIYAKIHGGAIQAYTINGRNIQHMTLSELRLFRTELQNEINDTRGPARNLAKFR
mgnify:CR=1 FL=1